MSSPLNYFRFAIGNILIRGALSPPHGAVLVAATSGRLIHWLVLSCRDLLLLGNKHPVYHDAILPIPSRLMGCISSAFSHVLLSAFDRQICGLVHVALATQV